MTFSWQRTTLSYRRKWFRMIACVFPSRTVMILNFSKSCAIKLIFPLVKAYSSQDIISGSRLKSSLKWKSLSFRVTVEVEMESWWAISVIDVFSINFWAMIALETALFKKDSDRHTSCFEVRNFRRFWSSYFSFDFHNQGKMELRNPA